MTTTDRLSREHGFSLVELMVALVILGLAATAVILTLPTSASGLNDEASRFAARAAALRDHAVVEARPMRLWVSASGYGFERRDANGWTSVRDRALQADDWPNGVAAQWNGNVQGRLTYDRLGLPDRAGVLTLSADGQQRIVRVDAAGNVQMDRQP